jgi:hypothetical protein
VKDAQESTVGELLLGAGRCAGGRRNRGTWWLRSISPNERINSTGFILAFNTIIVPVANDANTLIPALLARARRVIDNPLPARRSRLHF